MCFSFEASLATGLFSWSIGLFLLSKKLSNKLFHDVIFLLIFSSIQFVDALLWYNKMKRNNINYYATSIAVPSILVAQMIHNIYIRNKINNRFVDLWIAYAILYMFIRFNGYSVHSCNSYSSPLWGDFRIKYYDFIPFLITILYPRLIDIGFGIFYILLSIYIFDGFMGTGWCAINNMHALYLLFYYYNYNKLK